MRIAEQARDPQHPYENLLPILEALLASGNETMDGGFLLNPDGWRCRLRRPIDFGLIAATFELPSNISVSRQHDSVLDRSTWCVIEGPGASNRDASE